jgi:hypothetical protein
MGGSRMRTDCTHCGHKGGYVLRTLNSGFVEMKVSFSFCHPRKSAIYKTISELYNWVQIGSAYGVCKAAGVREDHFSSTEQQVENLRFMSKLMQTKK